MAPNVHYMKLLSQWRMLALLWLAWPIARKANAQESAISVITKHPQRNNDYGMFFLCVILFLFSVLFNFGMGTKSNTTIPCIAQFQYSYAYAYVLCLSLASVRNKKRLVQNRKQWAHFMLNMKMRFAELKLPDFMEEKTKKTNKTRQSTKYTG